VDPTGAIADAAADGAVVGAAAALLANRREVLTEWIAWGMVLGAGAGVLRLLIGALT
jgi:hypothetical protein